jgi:hypothetical protein
MGYRLLGLKKTEMHFFIVVLQAGKVSRSFHRTGGARRATGGINRKK